LSTTVRKGVREMKHLVGTRVEVKAAATLLQAYKSSGMPCRSLSELCSRAVREMAEHLVRGGVAVWIDSDIEALRVLGEVSEALRVLGGVSASQPQGSLLRDLPALSLLESLEESEDDEEERKRLTKTLMDLGKERKAATEPQE